MANVKTDIIEGLGEQQSQHTIQYAFCQKSCIDQTDMLLTHQPSHVIEDNNSNEDIYQCNICLKTFTVLARLTRHYRTHTGEKPFQCEFCSKSFSVKENLSVHRRIHTKERPYKCEICSRAFEHSGKLHRHMRIHTGERPHKCTICEKTFIQSGQLVIHMRTHTGEKPYVCTTCKKGFTCSKQLKVHSRTHTGEKPYSCDICGKSFGYNHVLKLHQVAHYGEKVYKCTICKDTFTSKKFMEMHIKNHSDNTNHIHQSSTQECAIIGEIQKSEAQVNKSIYENSAINRKENVGLRYVLQQPKLENQQSDKHLYNLLTHPHEFKQDLGTIALKSPVHVSVPVVYDRSEDSISNSNQQHQLLTPPSSNSSSPAGSPVMQQMVDLEAEDDQHNLPLRKRSKMFLKSFEAISSIPTVQLPNDVRNSQVPIRYNTVIHYAKAS